ncbi:MAG TPA: GNAT family N-acetyltransferase [bacterium]|nr:GNAT family N-acetyltransferase [bacterium]
MRLEEITGESIILRPLCEDEAEQVCEWRNQPELDGLFFRRNISAEEYKRWLKDVEASANRGIYAIATRDESKILGTLSFELQRHTGRESAAEIGIMIGDSAQRGKGFGAQAIEILSDYLSGKHGVGEIKVLVFKSNSRAISFYEKLGFKTDMLIMSRKTGEAGGQTF